MEDWQQRGGEYKEGVEWHHAAMTELRTAFRKLEWWPELDGARRHFEEAPAFLEFLRKLDGFAESKPDDLKSTECLMATIFWDKHIPAHYPKPDWYQPQEAPIFDVTTQAHSRGDAVDRDSVLAEVRADVASLRSGLQRRFDGIDEDSYVARLEAGFELGFVRQFEGEVAKAKSGGGIDLRRVGVNYGYDPEAVFADRSVGLEYIPTIIAEKLQYESHLRLISPFIEKLEDAGVNVRGGFREVWQDEYPVYVFGANQAGLNRYLDMKTEAPALIGILADLGARRLWLEERYEAVYEGRPDLAAKMDNDVAFVHRLEQKILASVPGDVIDLRALALVGGTKNIAESLNLHDVIHMPAGIDNRAEYETRVAGVEKYLARLEVAGLTIRTGFREIHAKDVVAERTDEIEAIKRERAVATVPSRLRHTAHLSAPPREKLAQDSTKYWANIAQSASGGQGRTQSESRSQSQQHRRNI